MTENSSKELIEKFYESIVLEKQLKKNLFNGFNNYKDYILYGDAYSFPYVRKKKE